MKRAIIIVLDSVGIGAMPDAHAFGDAFPHTLGNIYAREPNMRIQNLLDMGLGNIRDSRMPPSPHPTSNFGRAAEKTKGKDTTCGHWELMGIIMDKPFQTFPDGFPKEFIAAFEERIGRKTLGNYAASGTEIIRVLGDEHVRTGHPIIYTSADSVFQIAAHEEVVSLDELYHICGIARNMLTGDMFVGRVIARPFLGNAGAYYRTANRRDYAIPPIEETVLDAMEKEGMKTLGIGKIGDIFCMKGITQAVHTKNNAAGIDATIEAIRHSDASLILTNLVDFDMLYGHRNDVEGYARALEYFDARLPEIMGALLEEDLLIITADHGCDPTHTGTDHTREYVPVLLHSKACKCGIDLGTLKSFADIGATAYEYVTGKRFYAGTSFLRFII